MLFNSYSFLLVFLPITLAVARQLRGQRLLGWLVAASAVFYAFAGHVWFLVPMAITTVLDFTLAPFIAEAAGRRRRALLVVSLACNLGLLAYFKYGRLFVTTVVAAHAAVGGAGASPAWLRLFDVVLPAGISFYTFQTISYVIDVYRGQCPPERNFLKFAGFVTFFPHLVAGPLTRHHQLLPGLERIARDGVVSRWQAGTFLFAIGLCKKVLIADRVANVIDPILAGGAMSTSGAWLAMLGYAVQIYFDFSGYSDMAIGLGRLFGVELPQNFRSPYQATSPSDFWRRWHITLSQWLRDYLYISLGGNRCSAARRRLNLMATMTLGGLWHGASWTFAAWGVYHGGLLVAHQAAEPHWERLPRPLQRGLTFLLVCVGWVFFRATSFAHASAWLRGLVGSGGGPPLAGGELLRASLLVALALGIAATCPRASEYAGYDRLRGGRQVALGVVTAVAVVLMTYSSRFLYFQF